MNKRAFDKLCRLLFGKRRKGEVEPNEDQRHAMLLHVVRNHGPIHPKLITPQLDRKWIACMGYLYVSKKGFLCTCENLIHTFKETP